jgi:hypothetical protein
MRKKIKNSLPIKRKTEFEVVCFLADASIKMVQREQRTKTRNEAKRTRRSLVFATSVRREERLRKSLSSALLKLQHDIDGRFSSCPQANRSFVRSLAPPQDDKAPEIEAGVRIAAFSTQS